MLDYQFLVCICHICSHTCPAGSKNVIHSHCLVYLLIDWFIDSCPDPPSSDTETAFLPKWPQTSVVVSLWLSYAHIQTASPLLLLRSKIQPLLQFSEKYLFMPNVLRILVDFSEHLRMGGRLHWQSVTFHHLLLYYTSDHRILVHDSGC